MQTWANQHTAFHSFWFRVRQPMTKIHFIRRKPSSFDPQLKERHSLSFCDEEAYSHAQQAYPSFKKKGGSLGWGQHLEELWWNDWATRLKQPWSLPSRFSMTWNNNLPCYLGQWILGIFPAYNWCILIDGLTMCRHYVRGFRTFCLNKSWPCPSGGDFIIPFFQMSGVLQTSNCWWVVEPGFTVGPVLPSDLSFSTMYYGLLLSVGTVLGRGSWGPSSAMTSIDKSQESLLLLPYKLLYFVFRIPFQQLDISYKCWWITVKNLN